MWLEEENYYFLLSAYQERLAEFYRKHPGWVKPRSRYNEALAFIEQGLEDISISRRSITWGIPVPWDPDQVIYVWVDALINYLSALTYARPGEDLVGRYWPAQRAPAGQGHPQVPRRHLAGPADERRLRAARAASSSTATC